MFISTVVCLVPVVDCSEAVGVVEMTEVTVTFCMFSLLLTSILLQLCHKMQFSPTCFHINLSLNSYKHFAG